MKRRFDVALVAGLLALLGAAPPSSRAQPDGEDVPTIGLALMGHISTFSNDIIEIAPMTSAGNPVPGRYGPLNTSNDIFNSILQRAGITPGVSSPNSLESSEGFLEAIEESQVVNKGGRRATFGYFIRAREGASRSEVDENYSTRTNEFFLLFSYDWVRADEKILYAFEVFLFGPMQATGCLSGSLAEPVPREQEVEDPPRLLAGLAVGAQVSTRDGNRYRLLQEVPLEIARVSNYKGERDHENETVKAGVDEKGKGCLACHSRSEGMPQNTGPFPWTRVGKPASIDACLVRTWEATNVAQIPGYMTGGAKFRVTFRSDGTQIVDYRGMETFKGGNSTMTFDGRAAGRITTENGVARIDKMSSACATIKITSGDTTIYNHRLPSLGPGGLGTASDDNNYVCTPDSLEYKTSTAADGHAGFTVKLRPVQN